MSNAQLDIFAPAATTQEAPPAPVAQPAPELTPVAPTLAWARRLSASPHGRQVTVLVSWLWTGEVVESLSDGEWGRCLLHRDGRIEVIAPDPGAIGRTVFLDPRRAQQLHARHPLICIGIAGTHSARFRFAEPAQTAPATLELPAAIEDCAL